MLMKSNNKGLFITLEGGEGVGKTTLIENIYQALTAKGSVVFKTREPGGTKLGRHVREVLLHHDSFKIGKKAELFLFLADRSQHVEEIILPHLETHDVVLCDRFNDSTLAYQGAARAFEPEILNSLCQFAASNLKPDLTLFLDLDPALGLARKKGESKYDRIEKEDIAFHTKVREAYLNLAKKEPKRFHILDASLDSKTVFKTAMKLISDRCNL